MIIEIPLTVTVDVTTDEDISKEQLERAGRQAIANAIRHAYNEGFSHPFQKEIVMTLVNIITSDGIEI